jgi:hypothetical protein
MDVGQTVEEMARLVANAQQERERLLELREQAHGRYSSLLASALAGAPRSRPAAAENSNGFADDDFAGMLAKWFRLHPEDLTWHERVGVERHWFIREAGFHQPESYGSHPLRWTAGNASLIVPHQLTQGFRMVSIRLWKLKDGGSIDVVVNNRTARTEGIYEEGVAVTVPQNEDLSIELRSQTWKAPADARVLGVAVRHIQFTS